MAAWEVPFDTDRTGPQPCSPRSRSIARHGGRRWMKSTLPSLPTPSRKNWWTSRKMVKSVVRVSGPFTVEAVMPAEEGLEIESPIGGEPDELETFVAQGAGTTVAAANEPVNAEAYLDKMLRLLKADGVRFPNNKVAKFSRLESLAARSSFMPKASGPATTARQRRVCGFIRPAVWPGDGVSEWRTRSGWRASAASMIWCSPDSASMRRAGAFRTTQIRACAATSPTSAPT